MNILQIKVADLDPNPWNPNKMSSTVFKALEESFDEFGTDLTPLVVRHLGDRFQIIDGEHRYTLAQKKSINELPCIVVDYSDSDCKRLTQILNRTRGEDDPVKLKELFESLLDELPKEDIIKGLPYATPEDLDSVLLGLEEAIESMGDDDKESLSQELDIEGMGFDHECPKCGFEFNG